MIWTAAPSKGTVLEASGTPCRCAIAPRGADRCGPVRDWRGRVPGRPSHGLRGGIVPAHDGPDRAHGRARRPARHDRCPAEPDRPRPLRREGPAKLTGTALYTDDIVVPGAWYGATIRSTEAHATFEALDLDPAFDWSRVVVVTAADIPGENIVSSIKSDQPILVPVGGEIQHHAEPLALLAAPDRATLREARQPGDRPRRPGWSRSSTPRRATTPSRPTASSPATWTRPSPTPTSSSRGRVPRRPPGAAVHREQRDDRRPDRGRRA